MSLSDEALMAEGDLDGAIAKFESAHTKGPHFVEAVAARGFAERLQNARAAV